MVLTVDIKYDVDSENRYGLEDAKTWTLTFIFRDEGFEFLFKVNDPFLPEIWSWKNLIDGKDKKRVSFHDKIDGSITNDGNKMIFKTWPSKVTDMETTFSIDIELIREELREVIKEAEKKGLIFGRGKQYVH